jgi:hypothetical protein
MNIICLKWGDKFSHEHVNRLYRMVCKNFDGDFNFICHTENANGIDRNVIIQPLPDYDLDKWWWKLTLFQYPTKIPTLFLDLDVVIQNNITHLKDYIVEDMLCTVKCYWKPHVKNIAESPHFDMNLNSSVMLWQGDLTNVWNTFYKDSDYYMVKYNGIDSFLFYDNPEILLWLDRGEVYSRLYGYDEDNNYIAGSLEVPDYYYKPDYNICIFNGWRRKVLYETNDYLLDDEGYHGFEKYWD